MLCKRMANKEDGVEELKSGEKRYIRVIMSLLEKVQIYGRFLNISVQITRFGRKNADHSKLSVFY